MEKEEQEREEHDQIWQCFTQFDQDHSDTIATYDLKEALETFGERLSDIQLFGIISEADPNNSGVVHFNQFKEIVV